MYPYFFVRLDKFGRNGTLLFMGQEVSKTAAIDAALNNDWKQAIKLNKALLVIRPTDVDTLNRLAFAYLKDGQTEKSRSTYQKVLVIDKYNPIATKNLSKLANFKKRDRTRDCSSSLSRDSFIEEPGVTQIIPCVNLAPTSVLSTVSCGQEVCFRIRRRCVEIRTITNVYLAALPDDMSFRFLRFLQAGNTYAVAIKSINPTSLTLFVRELSRTGIYTKQPTFLTGTQFGAASGITAPKKRRVRKIPKTTR